MKSYVSISFTVLLFLVMSPFFNYSQVIKTGSNNASVNYDRLKRIDTVINDYINKNFLTGAVTLIVKDNQLIQYKGYGYQDVETKKPMKNMLFFEL